MAVSEIIAGRPGLLGIATLAPVRHRLAQFVPE